MTKVLITGGAGYIGSHTTLVLLEAGFDVVVIDNFSNSSPIALDRVSNLSGKKLIFIEGDIKDRLTVRNIFEQHSDISAVIHFAALKAVGESTEVPLKYYLNNVTGSIVLLEEMQNAEVKNLYLVHHVPCTESLEKFLFLKSFLPVQFRALMVEQKL